MLAAGLARFKVLLALGNLLVLGIVATATGQALSASYRAHDERARANVSGLAQTMALNVASTVELVDLALQSTLNVLDQRRDGPPLNAATLNRLMDAQRVLVPSMSALRITDVDGWVLNPDDDGLKRVSMADREYFLAAKAEPARLVVSEPLQGRLRAGWWLIFARARLDGAGRFAGVIYAGIRTDAFADRFKQVGVGTHGAVTLRSSTLRLIARHAPNSEPPTAEMGQANVSGVLKRALEANPRQGSFLARTPIDGVERISAYTQVAGYPLLMLVGLGTDDFFAPWRRQALELCSLLALLTVVLIGTSVALYRVQARQVQARSRAWQLAKEQGALLDNDLVGMLKLRDRCEVWHNAALARLFGYGAGELTGRPSRQLYLDDESFLQVGAAYQQLARHVNFRTPMQMRRKDGSAVWVDLHGTHLESGESLWMMTDITALKRSEEQARHLAFHDELTGLPNRHLLLERLALLLKVAERDHRWLAVCYLDLDGFKAINDLHGHDAGDAVLKAAAARLAGSVRANDVAARMGGDEFVLVLNEAGGLRDARRAEPPARPCRRAHCAA